MRPHSRHIALFLATLRCGGAERMMLHLGGAAANAGLSVDLVVGSAAGEFADAVPGGVRVIDLEQPRIRRCVFPLARYLCHTRPAGLITRVVHANLAAIAARQLAGGETRLVVTEANHASQRLGSKANGKFVAAVERFAMIPLMRLAYPRADAVVAVSAGVADDLKQTLRLPDLNVEVIPNPVVSPQFDQLAAAAPDHPWLSDSGPPVIISAGRLVAQKDFATLLAAFAKLRRRRAARLIIFGEGPLRESLTAIRDQLQLTCDVVDLPGHCDNVVCHFANADLVALSSRYEGSPNVLTEALATGCPVVATDCPSGPAELVSSDAVGMLVPVGDAAAMCTAMERALSRKWDRKSIRQSVAVHSAEDSAAAYLRVLRIVPPAEFASPMKGAEPMSKPRLLDAASSSPAAATSSLRT